MNQALDEEFGTFMRDRWPAMVRFAYALTGNPWTAEDVAQAAFTKAYAAWPRVTRARNPAAYVKRIVINEHRDRTRERRLAERFTEISPDRGADVVVQIADRSALTAALRALGPRQRAVVVLRYWLDLSEAEIAAAMSCSAGTVKSQASRALAALRKNTELRECQRGTRGRLTTAPSPPGKEILAGTDGGASSLPPGPAGHCRLDGCVTAG
jgi:RNA polymerase sigma-70 factor (sigma-E family)